MDEAYLQNIDAMVRAELTPEARKRIQQAAQRAQAATVEMCDAILKELQPGFLYSHFSALREGMERGELEKLFSDLEDAVLDASEIGSD